MRSYLDLSNVPFRAFGQLLLKKIQGAERNRIINRYFDVVFFFFYLISNLISKL